jgi:hypothetical protein
MGKKDISNLVERLKAFEEKAGVRLEAIAAFYETDPDSDTTQVTVYGEIHAASGTELSKSVTLGLVVYDDNSRVIGTSSSYFDNEDFFSFEAFDITCGDLPKIKLSRIRLIPKISG